MPCIASRQRQRGAVIVTAALTLLFLLGFMGIALDFGRLFVVKTELQTAMDSCALAAAGELDGQRTALTRATSAGLTAGNLNNVNLQSSSWNGQGKIVGADITFKDEDYLATTDAALAKYAKCQHTQAGTKMWLLQALGAFTGDTATHPAARSVAAQAVATRASAQTACMLPIGICDKAGGYKRGEWLLEDSSASAGRPEGKFLWLDFSANSGGTDDLKALLEGPGQCDLSPVNTRVTQQLQGTRTSAIRSYNTRFGIYKGNSTAGESTPDLSGYAYYQNTIPAQPPYPNKSADFLQNRRPVNSPYEDKGPDNPDLNLKVSGGGATVLNSSELRNVGASRRVVTVPSISCPIPANKSVQISSVACVFLLHPVDGSGSKDLIWLEYLGQANELDSPCSTFGLSGGVGGPLVPVLVR